MPYSADALDVVVAAPAERSLQRLTENVAAAIVEFLLAADRGYDFSSSGPSASTNSAPRNHSGVPGARCP